VQTPFNVTGNYLSYAAFRTQFGGAALWNKTRGSEKIMSWWIVSWRRVSYCLWIL